MPYIRCPRSHTSRYNTAPHPAGHDSEALGDPPIEIPHLEGLVAHGDSPRYFVLLNQRFATPQSAKRRLELRTLALGGWDRWQRWITTMLPIIEAANGLQHVYLRGGAKEGTFRTWTGDAEAPFEDAMLSVEMYWYGGPTIPMDMHLSNPILHLGSCDSLVRQAMGVSLYSRETWRGWNSQCRAGGGCWEICQRSRNWNYIPTL